MISQSGNLVCIEIDKDMATIGVVGIRGTGKSRMMHSLLDNVYHKRKDAVIVLNDQHNESLTYSLKGKQLREGGGYRKEEDTWRTQLEVLGMKPLRLPVVHCYPAITDAYEFAPNNITKLKIALRFENLFRGEELFEKELAGSQKYFRINKERLMRCKSEDEIIEILDEIESKQVREKLRIIITNLIQEKIVDFDGSIVSKAFFFDRNTKSKVVLPILSAFMASGTIPVLMTQGIVSTKYYSTYLKMILMDIFENQKKGYFASNRINSWVFIDELTGLDSVGERQPDEGMTTILQRIVTEGRPLRIGTVWATQNYSKVRPKIRSNTKYLIAFRFNSSTEVNEIKADFGLTDSQAETIKMLKKEYFECVAMTSEHFILYDLETGKRKKYSGYIRGYSLPTMSLHKQPNFSMPETNMQYAILYFKEKRFRIGNDRTNNVVLNDFTMPHTSKMTLDELGNTYFYPESVELSLFAPLEKNIINISYDELKTYGWEIYSYTVSPYFREFKQHRISYGLKKVESRTEPHFTIMTYCPDGVIIEMNPFGRTIRLKSPNIKGGFTAWRRIETA